MSSIAKFSIETVSDDETYYTYNSHWDDPSDKEFPTHRVGKGRTKESSIADFERYIETSYKPLLASVKENVRLACEDRK